MMDPTVLLLDEPSAGLSPVLTDEAFVRVREINRTGVTVIMVEQNAARCLQIVDRGYVLDQGRNAYTGSGRDLANDPKVIERAGDALEGLTRPRFGQAARVPAWRHLEVGVIQPGGPGNTQLNVLLRSSG